VLASVFQKTPDGRCVYFPWGMLGSGYIIEPAIDFNRLRGRVSLFTLIGTILPIAIYTFEGLFPSLIALIILMMFYWIWMRYELHGRQKWQGSFDPFPGSIRTQIGTYSPLFLWVGIIGSILLVAEGFWIVMRSPINFSGGLAVIILFSLSAISMASLLVARRRT
jgi:hypothetical protein